MKDIVEKKTWLVVILRVSCTFLPKLPAVDGTVDEV
jgi:hypothetical protein